VVGQVLLERGGQVASRRVADPVDGGADLGEAAGVLLHLRRVAGSQEDDLHGRHATTGRMRNVVFAAPFPLETTMRFARAAARLDAVRLLGVVQEAPG